MLSVMDGKRFFRLTVRAVSRARSLFMCVFTEGNTQLLLEGKIV